MLLPWKENDGSTHLPFLHLPKLDPRNRQPMPAIHIHRKPPSLDLPIPRNRRPLPFRQIILPIIFAQIPILLLPTSLQPPAPFAYDIDCALVLTERVIEIREDEDFHEREPAAGDGTRVAAEEEDELVVLEGVLE